MYPDFITFTGADDRTPYQALLDLSEEHPVEFGILFSRSRTGTPRYPSQGWIDGLAGLDLSLAAHICGSWSGQIVSEGRSDIDDRMDTFDRIQVNTSERFDLDLICAWKARLEQRHGREFRVILQTRHSFPEDARVEWLFDASGGRGVLPASWPRPPADEDVRFGYAGGLGPDNVVQALQAIDCEDGFWIDMESRVRNASDLFDLDMCRLVCERAF